MGTYNYDKVMSDYDNGRITAEMATGHSLQHIGKLYEALTAFKTSQYEWQTKTDTLEKRVNTMQTEIDRLNAFMEKVLRSQKRNAVNAQTQE
jgi:hypothetical protein